MRWPWSKPRPCRAEKVALASKLGVASQDVGRAHRVAVRATTNGLLANVSPDVRERVQAKLAAAQQVTG